jgi:hypothetical protein
MVKTYNNENALIASFSENYKGPLYQFYSIKCEDDSYVVDDRKLFCSLAELTSHVYSFRGCYLTIAKLSTEWELTLKTNTHTTVIENYNGNCPVVRNFPKAGFSKLGNAA